MTKVTADEGILINNNKEALDNYLVSLKESIRMKMNQEKLEEIYRRRFRQAADELLSKVYEKKYMGASEKSVMAGTQSMGEELVKLQQQMATETGLSGDVAERIGREIVEALALEKQQGLKRKGYVRRGQNEESDN